MKAAFLGLGLMGSRMARNIAGAGHELSVYNRSADKARPLAEAGARVAGSAAEAVAGAEAVMTMLADPEAVSQLATGEGGFLQAMSRDALWIDCSTVNPSFSRRMEAAAAAGGVRFMDAPVAGTTAPAERGELIVFAGAGTEELKRAAPLLEAVGKKTVHVGGVGMGSSMKMVVNLMLGQSMAAFSEATQLGEALGIERSMLLDTLLGGAVSAPFLSAKRENFESGRYEPQFPLQHMHKDLNLVRESAREAGVPALSTAVAAELFALAEARGYGGSDFSALFDALRSFAAR